MHLLQGRIWNTFAWSVDADEPILALGEHHLWGQQIPEAGKRETLRKYEILHNYFKERNQQSIFDRTLGQDDKYVLLGFTREECKPALDLPY